MIVFAGLVPHPPILIPEIGGKETAKVEKTVLAYKKLAAELAESDPDTIIIISPHMVHFPHLFTVCGMDNLVGSFANFGTDAIEWQGENDIILAQEIVDKSEDESLPAILYNTGEGLYEIDHGVMVPLHFIQSALDFSCKILPISYSYASRGEHYTFGQVIAEVTQKKRSERIAILASGDLSHRLIGKEAEAGKIFDKEFLDNLKKGDEFSVVNMDEDVVEKAGECAYRSAIVLLGALSGLEYKPEVYSYEGPFGVGYAVVNMGIKTE